jgi:very-short-patch-repair endonuclease
MKTPITARARQLRRAMTEAERALWRLLRSRALGAAKFRRQHPIPPYVADFACVAARLAVEVDGGQHGGPRDSARDAALARAGWRVLRVWNTEVLTNPEGVLQVVLAALRGAAPPSS